MLRRAGGVLDKYREHDEQYNDEYNEQYNQEWLHCLKRSLVDLRQGADV
jgi:hypothetical protein